ncbi:MAG TPA: hypothetical protein DF637_05800 [Rikenellaceae bacterium]|nr:hypothetical protein [Rikenellaceae bacterium]
MKTEPVKVFRGTYLQCEMVRSLLENAGIESYLKDEILGTVAPWWVEPGGAGAVKVFVSVEDEAQATLVVEQYEKNINEENTDE